MKRLVGTFPNRKSPRGHRRCQKIMVARSRRTPLGQVRVSGINRAGQTAISRGARDRSRFSRFSAIGTSRMNLLSPPPDVSALLVPERKSIHLRVTPAKLYFIAQSCVHLGGFLVQ